MNEQPRRGFSLDVPTAWGPLFGRGLVIAVTTFLTLQVKEFLQIGQVDTPASAEDAALIAGATVVVYAILKLGKF